MIFLAIGVHEYAHAKFADLAGDPTPSYYGRVTLNLTKHFELFGTIMIILTSLTGVGIGWGKPVPMDPRKMRNPRWDHFVAVLAGPTSNLLQAVLFGFAWRFAARSGAFSDVNIGMIMDGAAGFFPAFLMYGVLINLSLCLFNLLPIGPLDGMWILGTFLPEPMRSKWTRFNLTIGQFLFLGLVIVGQLSNVSILSSIILPPLQKAFQFLTGI